MDANTNGTNTNRPGDRLLTVREVADMLKIHPNTVRVWNNRGLIKAYRLGSRGDRRFSEIEILEYLANNGFQQPALSDNVS